MKKLNKKGFTLFEIVVVLAVMAALGVVIFLAYNSMKENADAPHDVKVVREMNIALAERDHWGENGDYVCDLATVTEALADADISIEDCKPLEAGNSFYLVFDVNGNARIILVDSTNTIVYPKEGRIHLPENAEWIPIN